jgi:hypothetical protein
MQIGSIPVATDSFEAVGLRFEVANMDGKRATKWRSDPCRHPKAGKGRSRNPVGPPDLPMDTA